MTIQRVLTTSTPSADGLMTAADKAKLDSVSSGAAVSSVATKVGAVSLVPSDVGLGDVDNKSSATIAAEVRAEIPPMRQGIISGDSGFLNFTTFGTTITLEASTIPLKIAYHDGEIETLTHGISPWTLTGQDRGIWYLYKEPSGYGMTQLKPRYGHLYTPAYATASSANLNRSLIPIRSGSTELDSQLYGSVENAGYEAWRAFDRNPTTHWRAGSATGWVRVDVSSGMQFGAYKITNGDEADRRDPHSWEVLASFTGIGEHVVDTISGAIWTAGGQSKTYYFSAPVGTSRLRFNFTNSTQVGTGTVLHIAGIEIYPNLHTDWYYSIPRQTGFTTGETEQKRVYLGEIWWAGTLIVVGYQYAVLGTVSQVETLSDSTSKVFYHNLGYSPESYTVSANLPVGSTTGGVLWSDHRSTVVRSDLGGEASVTARRAF